MNTPKTATVAACFGVVGRAVVENLLASGTKVVGFARPNKSEALKELEASSKGNFFGVTGIRLEALEHPSLPGSGPGTAGNGNFVLTELLLVASGTPVVPAVPSLTASALIGLALLMLVGAIAVGIRGGRAPTMGT